MDIDEIKRAAKRFMPEPWLYEVLRVLSEHDEALTEPAELRAYKEAAEMQEPSHIIDWEFDDDPDDVEARGDLIIHQLNGAEYPAGTPLYAKPVPADKPAVITGTNRYGLDVGYIAEKLGLLLRDIDNHKPDEAARVLARLAKVSDESVLREPEFSDKPARITEQDAMAILLEWDAYRAERSASGVTPAHFKKWLNLAGRALLNKLNADREQVPAVAVPGVFEAIYRMAQEFKEAWPEHTGKYHWMIGCAEEFRRTPSHSQQSAVYGYVISDGFTEQFVKTLSDDDRKAAKRFSWDVIPLCRCPSHEIDQQ